MMAGTIKIGIASGADSSSVLPIGLTKKMASTLVALNRAKSIGQCLRLLSKLRFCDFLPVSPAIAEYSTGLRMGDTAEQLAKTYHN